MAGFAKSEIRLIQPPGWFDQLAALLGRELAPSSRKLRTALRMTTIATLGAGLIVSCHVNNQLGTYIVWLLVGAGPMMAPRKAVAFLIAEAFALATSVVMAGILVESPWLMLPFLFALMSLTTYVGTTLSSARHFSSSRWSASIPYYSVVFAPDEIGWGAAGIIRRERDRLRHDSSYSTTGCGPTSAKRSCRNRSERASRAIIRGCSMLQTIISIARTSRGRRCHRRHRIFPHTWLF